MLKNLFLMPLFFSASFAMAEDFSVQLIINNEIPTFGISHRQLEPIIVNALASVGHNVVSENKKHASKIVVELNGWQHALDGGRTVLGKFDGVVYSIKDYSVVIGKGKAENKSLVNALRTCSAIGTDDNSRGVQANFEGCFSDFVKRFL